MGFDELVDSMKRSEIFMTIYTEEYLRDPTAALQLGLAVLLDLPIYFLAQHGTVVPGNVRAMARKIVTFADEHDINRAADELLRGTVERQNYDA